MEKKPKRERNRQVTSGRKLENIYTAKDWYPGCKELLELNDKQPSLKMGKRGEHFTEDDILVANMHMKNCTSLVIRECKLSHSKKIALYTH